MIQYIPEAEMVYTDGKQLIADTTKELHSFAQKSGLKKTFFVDQSDRPHYDVSKHRVRVIDNGAIYTKDRELFQEVINRCLKN